jgi:DnaJ family protein C protein 13
MASYIVIKHSWKGKYKRVLVIEPDQLSTFDPKTMKQTNCWPYDEVLDVAPLNGDLFKLLTRKKTGNTDLLKFSSEFRKDILCDIIRFRPKSNQTGHDKHPPLQYECSKFHWTRQELPAILELTTNAIVQKDTLGNAHAHYYFKHIGHISLTSNPPGCICIAMNGFGRLHLFRLTNKLKSNIREPDRLVDDFVKSLQTYAVNNCGISFLVKKDPIDINQFYSQRFGPKYSTDEALTSLHEFTVYKLHHRHNMRPIRRILCITNLALVERNPDTYQPVTLKPLNDIFSLIRCAEDPQVFSIEFAALEKTVSYTSTERDALLASLVESVRSSGNVDVHVKILPTNLSWRCGPLHAPVDDEIERSHLKAFVALPAGWKFLDAIYRFNTICPYSGLAHNSVQDVKLFSENKAKLIIDALKAFLDQTEDGGIPMFYAQDNNNIQQAKLPADIEQYYQALRRLVASKPGYAFFNQSERFRAYLGASIVETIKLNNDAITYAGFDVLCALMQPMHPDCDIRHEQLNKSSLLATKKFLESLLDVLKLHINRGTGALVVSSMLDFLTYALCAPYSETTDSSCFDTLLNLIASNGRDIYKLFQHPSLAIVKGAGLVIKAIILEGDPNVSKRMQELSLAEGALMKHFHIGLFSQFKDGRNLGVQYLSRHLVALWSIGSEETRELFRRMFPLGLLNYLDSPEKPPQSMITMPARDNLQLANQTAPVDSTITNTLNSIKDMHPSVRILERQLEQTILHWREQIGMPKRDDKLNARPVVLRKCRQRVKVEDNWDMFYYQFYQDHCKPDLIWNLKTREELKTMIENELRQFMTDRELAAKHTLISWNYHEFEVNYKSLADEIKIGDYFLRLLLEDSDKLMQRIQIKSPFHFLSDLYHRFLLNKRVDMRCTCLHAMSIIYENYMQEIGHFNDISYIVEMLRDCRNRTERDRLILLLEKFVMHKSNAKDFIDADGVTTLVDMVTLAHLHTQRAFIPTQTNVIEATTEMLAAAASKEWYYSNDDNLLSSERPDEDATNHENTKPRSHQGPFRFAEIEELWKEGKVNEKTKFWAQGMNGWKFASEISQMKWCILASGNPLMNESELATCILNIFIQICEYYPSHDLDGAIIRPFPRIKKYLSDAMCLPHIVQLLVTFDPVIVERVSTLLLLVIEENPMISQLYRSGLFFFILMYSGSNLIPIGRLLHATHLAQAYRADETSKTKLKSFLTYLLPDAMVCFLENHGPDRFAQIFLGEFDTPEAIWNGEMRRTMIEKIACHVADFTSRLKSNNRATYDYCPIAPITYEQLEDELFVDIYYLRNLCNTVKFPHWPIKDPVNLLKALLDAWKEEASREPSTLSLEDALKVLKLNPENYKHPEDIDEQVVKRAYRDLALKYHPDKNPDGAHIFQEIHKAYEFLSSKQARERASGSNPKNLILIFRSQSILFSQCSDELHPYKYSGYPMLIETIKNEVEDERLFSKSDPILAYACETAYHTLRCSAKNAEELRREAGLETLQQALSRCASVLSASSDPDDVCVQMCTNIVKCFTVASEFEACQQKLSELHSVVKDLNRILSYGKLIDLQLAAAECAAAFAKCLPLHELLFQSGIVFSLLLLLFKYDYTLEEGGVERNEGHNKQEKTNHIAKTALYACVRLYELNQTLYGKPIEAMLSPYVASFFVEASLNPHDLLKMLTSNVEIPYLIWNNSTRAELIDYLEVQQKGIIQSGECPDESYGADFEITSHKSELRVGNIFIRIFNRQPSYPLRDAADFVQALLNYVGSQSQYIQSALSLSDEMTLDTSAYQNVESCLKSLALAIKFNPGVEIKCIGYFKLLFSLLMINQLPNVQDMALHVIKNITNNGQCVTDIGNSDVSVYLWMILYASRSSLKSEKSNEQSSTSSPNKNRANDKINSSDTISNIYHDNDPISRTMLILDILLPMIANTQLVKETISKGGLVYLVDLFCNCTDETIRLRSSDLMARVTVDKLSGFQATLILNRFLPMIIVDAMKNSAKDAIGLFDNNQENPELIWNNEMRHHIRVSTGKLAREIYEEQVKNPDYCWQMPQDFNLLNATNQEELVVAGVYLRLFNQNPTWVLRKPRDFLTELMNTFQALIKSATIEESKLETVTQALKNLLSAQPALLELIPAMGHVHSIITGIYSKSNKNELVSKSCLTILSELGSSRACVDNMSTRDTLLNEIKSSMVNIPDTVDIACFGLRKIYEFAPVNDRIVQQALEANFITYLLEVLNSNHSAQTRALIVKVLKSMTKNQTYGPQVETILGKSQTWSEYSDQKHDLFISNEPSLVAIAAPTANIAGYLQYNTQTPAQPPPVDK